MIYDDDDNDEDDDDYYYIILYYIYSRIRGFSNPRFKKVLNSHQSIANFMNATLKTCRDAFTLQYSLTCVNRLHDLLI